MANVTKTLRYLGGVGTASIASALPLGMAATRALAVENTWGVDEILDDAGGYGDQEYATVNGEQINARVRNITGWALGVAIALFVLRIVLTAIDRMVLGGQDQYGQQRSVLSAIPIVGAYPPPSDQGGYTWKDIWVNFAKNLAIVVGAWILVNAVVGIVRWAMNSFVNGA